MRLNTGTTLFLTICLSACSGGSSDEVIPPAQNPPAHPAGPSPFPAEKFSLVFDEENAPTALGLGVIMPKVALRLAQDHAQSLLLPLTTTADATTESYYAFCQRADGFQMTHDDLDANAMYSAGDGMRIVLDDCIARETGESVSGNSYIEISSFDIASDGGIHIAGQIRLTDFTLILTSLDYIAAPFSGSYEFSYQVDNEQEQVRAMSIAGEQLALTDGIDTLAMRNFSAYKSAPFDRSEYSIEFQHEMAGNVLDGSYGCSTVVALTAKQSREFTGYELDCMGKDDQSLRVIPIDQTPFVVLGDEALGIYELDRLIGSLLTKDPVFSSSEFQADLYAEQLLLGVGSLADDSCLRQRG